MENLPESLLADAAGAGAGAGPSSSTADLKSCSVEELVQLIAKEKYRDNAISLLVMKRETCREMALLLWNSFDTVSILLMEVINVYKLLTPTKLTLRDSFRVCNVLTLLQCVASHQDTKISLIKAKIPVYVYPFLSITENGKPFEFLRLISLGILGAIVEVIDPQIIHFLLETEAIPLCFRCMEVGSKLAKAEATSIVSRILLHEEGLSYCCASYERYFAIEHVLRGLLEELTKYPKPQMLKDIILCYLRLSESPRGRCALRHNFPTRFRDASTANFLREEPETMRWLQQLYRNVLEGNPSGSKILEDEFRNYASTRQ